MANPCLAMVSVAVIACCLVQPASAQETEENERSELRDQGSANPTIVVTAQKREELLTDVPIAVSAFSAEDLTERNTQSLNQLSYLVPGFVSETEIGGFNSTLALRGIAPFTSTENSVGVYIDGLYLPGAVMTNNLDLLSVERIEILRGPQGTLFGKNATAGVVNIITRRPDGVADGGIEVQYGNYDHVRVSGRADFPLSSITGLEVGVLYEQRDGFVINTANGQEFDDVDRIGGRIAFGLFPDPAFRLDIGVDYLKDDSLNKPLDFTPFDRKTQDDIVSSQSREVFGTNFNSDIALSDEIGFTALGGYRGSRLAFVQDVDHSAIQAGSTSIADDVDSMSLELRLASTGGGNFQWLGGLYGYLQDRRVTTSGNFDVDQLIFCIGQGICPPPTVFGAGPFATNTVQGAKSAAVFGQGTLELGGGLSATLGGRITTEKRDITLNQAPSLIPIVFPFSFTGERSSTNFSPRAALEFQPRDNMNIYASFSRGYKSGDFNNGIINPTTTSLEALEYEDEVSDNYEVGFKTRFWNNRGALNVALFYIDYKNLQIQQVVAISPFLSIIVANVPRATSRGVEVETSLELLPGLHIDGAASYNPTEYEDFPNCSFTTTSPGPPPVFSPVSCAGNRLYRAPKFTGSIGARYTAAITNNIEAFIDGRYSHRGSVFFDVQNSPAAFRPSYDLVDAQIGVADREGAWRISLWGRNLTDEDYLTTFAPSGTGLYTLGSPRTYGVTVGVGF